MILNISHVVILICVLWKSSPWSGVSGLFNPRLMLEDGETDLRVNTVLWSQDGSWTHSQWSWWSLPPSEQPNTHLRPSARVFPVHNDADPSWDKSAGTHSSLIFSSVSLSPEAIIWLYNMSSTFFLFSKEITVLTRQ